MDYEPLSQFTERILTITDNLLNEPLDPVHILYKKSDDLSLPLAGYETLMRAARYLDEQLLDYVSETEMEYELRTRANGRSPFHLQ